VTNVRTLILRNYRNHETLSLHFGDGINLIVGRNAQGKTNILESIYLLGKGRSFRAQDHRDMVKWGENGCVVEAEIEKRGGKSLAAAYLSDDQKAFKLDGKKKRVIPGIPVVLFVPQDITLFRELPQIRRNYLNDFISALDPSYRAAYREFSRTLTQRNRVLKEGMDGCWDDISTELEVWSDRLVERGTEVMLKREEWIRRINVLLPQVYSYMGGVGDEPEVQYRANINPKKFAKGEIREEFYRGLDEREELERIRGVTLVGPHRDDWSAKVGGRDIRHYGSQSQMRIMALSLKVSELELIKGALGEAPLLLLDDVISELDEVSAERLLSFVREMEGQVFITSTDKENVMRSLPKGVNVLSVSGGKTRP